MEWLIAAGLHPRAGATTLRIARDLAARMDYDTGHVRYSIPLTMLRTGLGRTAVTDHIRYLRELGALAWAVHGTRSNIRRLKGLPGYAGTATVYAATIPAVYDHAMGHRIIGAGYEARIIVDLRTKTVVDNPTTSPVDNPAETASRTPSLTVVKEEGQVQIVGGFKDTSRKRASRRTASPRSPKKASNDQRPRRSPKQVAVDCWIAAQVRPRVNWTQRSGIRQLAHALRPLIDRGLDADNIATELNSWWLDWRPERPAAYIRARLTEQGAQDAAGAVRDAALASDEWQAAMDSLFGAPTAAVDCDAEEEWTATELTPAQIAEEREEARFDLTRVVDYMNVFGVDAALDLYGTDLMILADRFAHSAPGSCWYGSGGSFLG